jgi:hypothetical protein
VEAVDLTQTAEQFRASSGVLAESMHQDRKLFFQPALDEVVVKKSCSHSTEAELLQPAVNVASGPDEGRVRG